MWGHFRIHQQHNTKGNMKYICDGFISIYKFTNDKTSSKYQILLILGVAINYSISVLYLNI